MARRGSQVSGTRILDFSLSEVSAEGTEVARKMAPAGIVVRQGGSFPTPHNAREVVIFLLFLVVGAAPPFSPFLMAVLEDFAIHLVHLTPTPFSRWCCLCMRARCSWGCSHWWSCSRTSSPSAGRRRSPLALVPPRNPVLSAGSSSGGVARASSHSLGGASGRTGSGIGCTSRCTTCRRSYVSPRGLRPAITAGPRRRCLGLCGHQ